MLHRHSCGVHDNMRSAFNAGMKRLDKISDWIYQWLKWIVTPLFLWIIFSRGLGWLEFGWFEGAYILGYVFIYLPSLKK